MSWVKSDWRFDEGCAIFFVTHKHMLIERTVFEFLERADDPVGLENALRELLKKYRPELAEASIYYLGFNVSLARWEFGIAHPSLAKVKWGETAPRRPLDPAYERDVITDPIVVR